MTAWEISDVEFSSACEFIDRRLREEEEVNRGDD